MTILETRTDRILLLIEQLKLNLKSRDSIENTVKKSAVFYKEFDFLNELDEKIKSGMSIEESVKSQTEKESSGNVKQFLNSLTAKELAVQKLEELRVKIVNDKKAELEKLLSVGSKIGIIAGIMFVPLILNFFSSLSEVLAVAEINITISESTKLIVLVGCAIAITYLLFSKREKNG